MDSTKMNIWERLNTVRHLLAQKGIGKDGENKAQGYKYRKIDDIHNALCVALTEAGVVISKSKISIQRTQDPPSKDKNGNDRQGATNVLVKVKYLIASVNCCGPTGNDNHGEYFTYAVSVGEGKDSGDKATAKAATMAYKGLVSELFSIPFSGVSIDSEEEDETESPPVESISSEGVVKKTAKSDSQPVTKPECDRPVTKPEFEEGYSAIEKLHGENSGDVVKRILSHLGKAKASELTIGQWKTAVADIQAGAEWTLPTNQHYAEV